MKKLLLLFFASLFMFSLVSAFDWSTGLVGYYNLNSDSKDSLKLLNGTDTAISYSTGKIGNSATFDGSTSFIVLPNSTKHSIPQNLTIAYWVYLDSSSDAGGGRIHSKGLDYFNIVSGNTGTGYFATTTGGGTANTGTTTVNISNGWHYLVVGQNQTHRYIYIDTTLNKAATVPSNIVITNNALYFGANAGSSEFMKGKIDEVGIWNRTLSVNEITTLYNSGNGLTYNTQPAVDVNSVTYNLSDYETSRQEFIINVSNATSLYTSINANFYYNGTLYSNTKTQSGNSFVFNSTVGNIGLSGSKTFFWNFTFTNVTGTYYANSTYTQTVSDLVFTLCNSTYAGQFLNISFKDETTNLQVNGTLPLASFNFYLGDTSVKKNYQFTNNTINLNYAFCTNVNRTFHIEPNVQYAGTGYPQRVWNPDVTDYTNSTTNQVLYLLSSSSGIYVTFQITNQADQVLSGVDVLAIRTISGTNTTMASGTTGADGTVTFWLNPDFSHYFSFTKSGYTTYNIELTPTQSSYTIQLSSSSASPSNDYTKGVSYFIKPTNDYLNNNTIYNFNYTLSSVFWEVSSFGFNLKLLNGTILYSNSTSSNGGFLSLNLNTSSYKNIVMDYYWVINSTYMNHTTTWVVFNTNNNEWSIATFFTDLRTYMDAGIFGLDDFGKYLIIFLLIFCSIGVFSYKYGLTSPIAVFSMIFALVFLFDVVLGLLPTPLNAIPHSITYLALLILVVLIVKEAQQ